MSFVGNIDWLCEVFQVTKVSGVPGRRISEDEVYETDHVAFYYQEHDAVQATYNEIWREHEQYENNAYLDHVHITTEAEEISYPELNVTVYAHEQGVVMLVPMYKEPWDDEPSSMDTFFTVKPYTLEIR